MNKNMKKIATVLVATNVLASTFITALPNTVSADETTSQGEKKLLNTLQATSVPIVQNANFKYDSSTNTIPGWKFASVPVNGTVTGDSPLISNGNGSYNIVDGNFRVTPNATGISAFTTVGRFNVLYQTINTIPGETYTFKFCGIRTAYSADLLYVGLRVYDATTSANIVNVPLQGAPPTEQIYSTTFVATGSTTRLEIVNSCANPYRGNNQTIQLYNVSATAANTTAPNQPEINPMTDKSTVIKGTAKAYSTVSLYAGSSYIGDTRADASGNYSLNAGPYAAGTKIGATATASGLVSDKNEITVSATAIAKPTINTINDKSVNASGTGEPSSTLTLKIGDATYTANVNADGNWSTTITKPKAGLVAEATSVKAGVTSPKESTTVVDVTAPDAPILSTVTDKDTHVKGTGEANTTVKIKLPNNTEITGTVDTEGKFDVIIPAQAKDAVISATLTDAANNVSLAGATTVVHAAPSAPLLDTVTDKSTKVTGTGDVGNTVTVKITDNGMSISYTGTVDDFGDFSIPIDTPKAGATVDAIAKDKTNALSPKTSTTVKDVTAPDAPNVNTILDTDTTITGNGEANCDVKVTLPSGGVLTGRTNATGVFTIALPAQAAGKEIKVTLTDAASNESTATPVIVQSSAIASPTINSVTTDDTTVKGTGTTGATVTLTIGSATYTGTVIDGSYTISIPKQTVGTIISAKQALNGRTSASVTTTVTAGKELAKTSINPLTNDSTIVSGTGEPNASIEIKNAAGTVIATGSTDAEGDYSLTIPKQTTGAVVTANVTKDGKSSSASTTVTKQTAGTVVVNAAYYVGYDNNVKATVSGDATKVYLLVGDTKYTTVPVNGSFQYYAKDKITSTTQNAYIVATDASGRELSRAKVTLKDGNLLKGAVTANGFTISDSSYVSGSFTGSVSKVAISVNGTVYPAVAVGANNKFQYYAKDKIKNTTDVVKVIGYNSEGTSIATTTVTVTGPDSLTGTITPNPSNFVISTDAYVKGTFTGNVKYVSLVVNSVESAKVNVVDATNWQYYAKGKITNPTDVVSVKGYNAAGTLVDTKTITVTQNPAGTSTITPAAFKLKTDTTVKGTFTGSVKSVALKVGDTVYSKVNVVDATNWQYYAKDKIKNTTDAVSIIGYDSTGTQIVSAPVTVNPENTATLTTNTYTLGADNATGTYTGPVKYVAVKVNDTTYSRVPVNADGSYKYYIKDKVKSKDDVVTVLGYDDANTVIVQKVVKIDPGIAPTLTTDEFVIDTTRFVTGKFTGGVKYVGLKVGDTVYDRVPVSTDGTYQYYAKDKIKDTTTTVTVLGYDATNTVTIQTIVTVK
ncbi:autolysin modifier protein [Listeria grandensis]|uniref:immunoglobulin-like domain-containing protein n=1 Tax=Listeria grandensis TaxID=1494963 RepID=UPI00162AC0C4|nr:immunoglobulin-like domain-containing protein [Listeria grandensis]MBC1474995.1 autolysin modifier protein [Listeria grandensis]